MDHLKRELRDLLSAVARDPPSSLRRAGAAAGQGRPRRGPAPGVSSRPRRPLRPAGAGRAGRVPRPEQARPPAAAEREGLGLRRVTSIPSTRPASASWATPRSPRWRRCPRAWTSRWSACPRRPCRPPSRRWPSAAPARPSCSRRASARSTRAVAATQAALLATARASGLRLVGPNCMGVYSAPGPAQRDVLLGPAGAARRHQHRLAERGLRRADLPSPGRPWARRAPLSVHRQPG